jgi:predicted Zn-dependent protease
VFESEQANAFALPGGKVGIYTGILSITKDETGLATVIGHEVAHASKSHGAERMSRALAIQFGGSAISALLSGTEISDNKKQAVTTVYGLGMNLGVALPNSRVQESEADQIGLLYMARAGYDPAQAVEFWKRFKEINDAQGTSTPWFLRTHPLDQTRIDQLQEWLPAAKREYRARN